jgi:hypothetical protein
MTKGHVVLGSLYTKMRLDVKNYFEPDALVSDRQTAGKSSWAWPSRAAACSAAGAAATGSRPRGGE